MVMKKKRIKSQKTGKAMEKITRVFELPSEILGRSRMVLSGNSDLFIENHGGICKYTPTEICVKVPELLVCVRGAGLLLKALGKENLIIFGEIGEIIFEPERKDVC